MKDFVPYNEALALKELGFNEPCFAAYYKKFDNDIGMHKIATNHNFVELKVSAPTFSQAFRFFREKYSLYHFITRNVGINTSDIFFVANYYKGKKGNSPTNTCISSKTYEQAELECLRKLIELCKSK